MSIRIPTVETVHIVMQTIRDNNSTIKKGPHAGAYDRRSIKLATKASHALKKAMEVVALTLDAVKAVCNPGDTARESKKAEASWQALLIAKKAMHALERAEKKNYSTVNKIDTDAEPLIVSIKAFMETGKELVDETNSLWSYHDKGRLPMVFNYTVIGATEKELTTLQTAMRLSAEVEDAIAKAEALLSSERAGFNESNARMEAYLLSNMAVLRACDAARIDMPLAVEHYQTQWAKAEEMEDRVAMEAAKEMVAALAKPRRVSFGACYVVGVPCDTSGNPIAPDADGESDEQDDTYGEQRMVADEPDNSDEEPTAASDDSDDEPMVAPAASYDSDDEPLVRRTKRFRSARHTFLGRGH